MKAISFVVLAFLTSLAVHAQDAATSRSVTGREQAAHAAVIINQVDTSAYPKVAIFATVLKNGSPLRGLTATDFKVREDEAEQEPLTIVPKLTPLSAVVTLDTSGSMKKRMAEAQGAAKAFIDSLNPQDRVQVLAFSREVKLLAPATTDRAAAKASIDGTVARGDTALYDALYASVASLQNTPGRKAITLLSDGADDDGSGRPLSKKTVADVLALARSVNVPIYTVGIGDIDRAVLEKVALESGGECLVAPEPAALKKLYAHISEKLAGQYYIYYTSNLPGDGSAHRVQLKYGDATSTKDYQSPVKPAVLAQKAPPPPPATPAPTLTAKEKSVYGEAIRGGDSYEKAVTLKTGKLYHLDHDQLKNDFDYFVVEAKPGQKLVATINTTLKEKYPYAGIALHSPQRTHIDQIDLIGSVGSKSAVNWIGEGKGGKYYVLVGSTYNAQGSDANFQVNLINQFDAGTELDAGSVEDGALEIKPGIHPENHLTNQVDDLDIFKFKAKGGTAYQVKVRAGNDSSMKLEAIDADGVKLADGQSPNAGAVGKIEKASIARDGWIYLKVSANYQSGVPELTYSLALGEGDVDSPPRPKAAP